MGDNSSTEGVAPDKPENVPNPKQPKTRYPNGFREKILRTPLPYYSGPYSVGMMDIEVPVREPRSFSHIKRNHRHVLELETVLFSVFYPSKFGSGDGPSPEGLPKWSRPTWLPRPRVDVAKGYALFAGIPSWVMIPWFGMTTAFTKIPAFRNAKLATHWPPKQNSREDEAGYQVKNKAGEPPPGEPESPCFPLLIFSHGLGGTRTTYSTVCGEFASYGFVVISLEHRDGSGPRTYVNLPNDGDNLGSRNVDHSPEAREQGWEKYDYIFPKGNAKDTTPGNKQGVDKELRSAQIQLRLAEIEEAYHVMTQIKNGDGELVAKANLRDKKPGHIGGSSRGLGGIDWASWKDRFHLQQVTMIGHSFGGATAVAVLRHQDRFSYVSQGILYDPWGGAIQPPEDNPKHRIRSPILCISSEAFMYWPFNFESIMTLCHEAKDQGTLCWLLTVRGSVHLSQSDFSILYPGISSFILKMTINPRRAIDLNINASLEFLKKVMPERISNMNRGTNEHLLEAHTLDALPTIHRPQDKWTAVRLRIPHELSVRLMPTWARRYVRNKKTHGKAKLEEMKKTKENVPRDPKGRPLKSLDDLVRGEETWMHVAPTAEELSRHGLQANEESGAKQRDQKNKGGMVGEEEGSAGGGGGRERERINSAVERKAKEGRKGIEERMMERG
ncbi:platelet-activating factor acetylhydrolase protein [Rutstroemia sp. NJR-2017a WRK4]|nr:platelet-activating factor acetylhydrolase protein [Rutstroemia sp. NJR-2017a WRK4]